MSLGNEDKGHSLDFDDTDDLDNWSDTTEVIYPPSEPETVDTCERYCFLSLLLGFLLLLLGFLLLSFCLFVFLFLFSLFCCFYVGFFWGGGGMCFYIRYFFHSYSLAGCQQNCLCEEFLNLLE